MLNTIKNLSGIMLVLFSVSSFAETLDPSMMPKNTTDTINVTVSIDSKEGVAGIGYSVDGKKSGGPGCTYTGTGPINKKYLFGYRKQLHESENIKCGALILTKDCQIRLVNDGHTCHITLQ